MITKDHRIYSSISPASLLRPHGQQVIHRDPCGSTFRSELPGELRHHRNAGTQRQDPIPIALNKFR